jgi:hypothetical protein
MAVAHQTAGVNEVNRNVVVVPSIPYPIASQARATATATVVPSRRNAPGAPNV